VEVVLEGEPGAEADPSRPAFALAREEDGYFSGRAAGAGTGARYRYRLDGEGTYPDPWSRFQPAGPHGPSQVVDPAAFPWTDGGWTGVEREGQVVYEMHVGTFTPEGTWEAAARMLPEVAACGVTVLELMPVAEFPGRFGWGYDGVDLFAPTHLYGTPDDFRAFVDRAHASGLGVILDVVYNHLGPDGCYLTRFSRSYFSDRYANEWGDPVNFDGPGSAPVREMFVCNAAYWVDEFHLDGLRLDATQQIFDASPEHVLVEIGRAARRAGHGRSIYLVAENEPQRTRLVRPVEEGGAGLDALWNDDFHHSALVAAAGRNEAYYVDYRGTPQELVSAVKWGYLFQGQRYLWQSQRRGTPTFGLHPAAFVNYLENHDQVANSARGRRLHQLTSPGRHRALTALLLLAPGTPMLFQGQEFSSSRPFLYFADHVPALAAEVWKGRAAFLAQFPSIATPETMAVLPDPGDPETFARCKLDHAERERNRPAYDLHRDLLRLRREDPVFRAPRRGGMDGAVLAPEAFVLRFFGEDGDDRLLVVNLGRDLRGEPTPEPLLGPPEGRRWRLLWSSEDPRYGGGGTPDPDSECEGWRIPGHAAVVLAPGPIPEPEEGAETGVTSTGTESGAIPEETGPPPGRMGDGE
jgi:maltooligosyltrehalose trehalohydrolase